MRTQVVSLLLVCLASTAHADGDSSKPDEPAEPHTGTEKGTFGIGLMIGDPTGICGRLYVSDDRAIQGGLGAAFIGGGLQAHIDYVFHPKVLQVRDSFVLAMYIGPGARVIQYRNSAAGAQTSYFGTGLRLVGGLLFDFKSPLDAFIEVAGIVEWQFDEDPGPAVTGNVAGGVRYYF